MSGAPFTRKKPKKPEYEEPPTITLHETPEVFVPPEAVDVTPTTGGVVQPEKSLPATYLGQEHPYEDRFAPKKPIEQKVIYGRSISVELPREKPVSEATSRKVEGQRSVTPAEWANAASIPAPTTAQEPRTEATQHRVVPKDKEDAAHPET